MKDVNVLILEDSVFMREFLSQELEQDRNIHVVAKVSTAFEARDKIIELRPDIMISDVYMNAMNGLEFIRQLLPQYYLPVIVMSSDPKMRAPAKQFGAEAFIEKPAESTSHSKEIFIQTMMAAIKSLMNKERLPHNIDELAGKIIAIGASTGGAEAIETILKELPAVMPPIIIGQHMPPKFTQLFADRLNKNCALTVKEAAPGDVIRSGQAYIAPGGRHTTVVGRGKRFTIECTADAQGNNVCPNIDILLSSVASHTAGNAMGIILTGMGRDGTIGLQTMKDSGALTVSQDEKSSVVYGMPKVAFESGASDIQLPLSKIARLILDFSKLSYET